MKNFLCRALKSKQKILKKIQSVKTAIGTVMRVMNEAMGGLEAWKGRNSPISSSSSRGNSSEEDGHFDNK